MADMAQVLATGGTALVSAAAGAGLTYWLGAMNRRHQEAREDRTRWYEARLKAYADFYICLYDMWVLAARGAYSFDDRAALAKRVGSAVGLIQLVGSTEVAELASTILEESAKDFAKWVPTGAAHNQDRLEPLISTFLDAARQDLGHFEAVSPPE